MVLVLIRGHQMEVDTGATWRIRLNRPCVVSLRHTTLTTCYELTNRRHDVEGNLVTVSRRW